MAVNPLLVGAGAAAAWFLFGRKPADSGAGSGVPSGDKAAAVQQQINVINAALQTGTMRQAVVPGMMPTAVATNPLSLPITATARIAGVANAVSAINQAAVIGSEGWAARMSEWPSWPGSAKPWAAYYWKIRSSINYFIEDAANRMAAIAPTISVVSVMASPTFANGVQVNPLNGFAGYTESQALAQYKMQGIDPASLLQLVLAGIYSGIEEVWAYNAAYRKFLALVVPGAQVTELDKYTMSEDAFWTYVNGTLLGARIIAGEEWNAGVDLKYGDSGVNLRELGYSWLENWGESALGTGARILLGSSHAVGAAMAIAASAKMGYSQTWPGDAQFTAAINRMCGLGWDSVDTRMIRDPASGLAVDVVASREQNKVVAYVPT